LNSEGDSRTQGDVLGAHEDLESREVKEYMLCRKASVSENKDTKESE
jgi:hypothetical protein